LVLRKTVTGILVGPCLAPVPGRTEQKYWIKLRGTGPVYTVADLEFVDEKGTVWPKGSDLEGDIRFDDVRHRVIVSLRRNGEALPMNGSYRYKMEA
jgi:hypothetical protein